MLITNKKLKKKIKEFKAKLHPLKEESSKFKTNIQHKQEELSQIKTTFYSKYPEEDLNKESNQQMIDENSKLLNEVFALYKENIDKTKKKIIIEFNIDLIREKSQSEYKKLIEKINEYKANIRELDENITKSHKEIEKYIKSSEIEFDIENYIINPTLEYTNHVAESQLAKQVLRRLERLLKHSKKETEEITEEYAERKAEADEIKEKFHVNNHTNNSKSYDDTKMTSKEILKKTEKALNEEDKDKPNDNGNIDDDDDDNEENEDNVSIELDTSVLTKEHIQRFIESPRFIDKVVTQNSALIKPLKLCLNVESPHEKATILKVIHIEREKISFDRINKEIEETAQNIIYLRSEYDSLLKKNKQLNKKQAKLNENIAFVNNKIEILNDQIEFIDEQMKVNEEENKVPDDIKEMLKKSNITINNNFVKT